MMDNGSQKCSRCGRALVFREYAAGVCAPKRECDHQLLRNLFGRLTAAGKKFRRCWHISFHTKSTNNEKRYYLFWYDPVTGLLTESDERYENPMDVLREVQPATAKLLSLLAEDAETLAASNLASEFNAAVDEVFDALRACASDTEG